MKTKTLLMASAAAALFLAGTVPALAGTEAGGDQVMCSGINACKGQSACAGAGHACAGKNACKGQGLTKTTESDCLAKGGKVVEGHEKE